MSYRSLSMIGLSKSRILAHKQCPRRLWLQVRRSDLIRQDASTAQRLAVGHSVGEIGRALYPEGHLVAFEDLSGALRETIDYIIKPAQPIFEPTFEIDHVLARVNLLLPSQERWAVIQKKCSREVINGM